MRFRLLALAVLSSSILAFAPVSGAGAASPRDFFNLGAAIGSPGEAVSGKAAAGVVHVFRNASPLSTLETSSSIMLTRSMWGETPAANDRFGASVAVGDLNDDNLSDVAIGAPGVGGGSGRVYVAYRLVDGSFDPGVLSAAWSQGADNVVGTSEPGDNFGAAIHIGARSGGEHWLAIGAPGEDIGSANGAGALTLLSDDVPSPGFSSSVYQGKGAPGTAESGDGFGSSLADFGLGGLAVGAPGEDIGSTADAGHVVGMAAMLAGLPGSGAETGYQQGAGGVPGTSEAGDHFGAALEGRLQNSLSIGIPGEDVGTTSNAGAVIDLPVPGQMGVTATLWYQGHNGLLGAAEAGDAFGSALSATNGGNLVVGAPGEDVGPFADAGIIHVIPQVGGANYSLTGAGDQSFHSDSTGVAGAAEAGDRFGAALGEGINNVLVGVPGEDVGSVGSAGALVLLRANSLLIDTSMAGQQITQDTAGVPSTAEPGDAFGGSVSGRQSGSET